MRFNRFLHLIAFAGKAHRGSPASGGLTTKMPDGGAPSQAMSQPDFSPYLPLSAPYPPIKFVSQNLNTDSTRNLHPKNPMPATRFRPQIAELSQRQKK